MDINELIGERISRAHQAWMESERAGTAVRKATPASLSD